MSSLCPLCGDAPHDHSYRLMEGHDLFACRTCQGDISRVLSSGRGISVNGYHDRSRIIRPRYVETDEKKPDESRLYMGMEVETDQDRDSSSESWSDRDKSIELNKELYKCGWLHVFNPTGDGSLHHGIEFVSQPGTIDWWVMMKPMLVAGTRAIIASGLRAHNTSTCGLHVHASRSFFKKGGVDDSVALLNLSIIVEQNWNAMTQFARRGQSSYAKRTLGCIMRGSSSNKITRSQAKEIKQAPAFDRWLSTDDRYRAVNYVNGRTIEFRFFKGTLNPETLMATLQLVHNLCHVAKVLPTEVALEYTLQDVINYRKYPELVAYSSGLDLRSNVEAKYQEEENDE